MANNYCAFATEVRIPKDKHADAVRVVARILSANEKIEHAGELEVTGRDGPTYTESLIKDSIYIWAEEAGDVELAVDLLYQLVQELELPGVHTLSWANYCDHPRAGEFGGGCAAVQLGQEPVYVDAESEALIKMAKASS